MKYRHSKVRRLLGLLAVVFIVSNVHAAERLVVLQGHTIMEATLDSMIVLPGGGVVNGSDLYMGF